MQKLPEPTGIFVSAAQAAQQLAISDRAARKRLSVKAESLNGNRCLYIREVCGRGGKQFQYDLALIKAAWPQFELNERFPAPSVTAPEVVAVAIPGADATTTGRANTPPVRAPFFSASASLAHDSENQSLTNLKSEISDLKLDISKSPLNVSDGQALLPFQSLQSITEENLIPDKKKLAWAKARYEIIRAVIEDEWQIWRGQVAHGIEISNLQSYAQALAKDSQFEIGDLKFKSVMLDWQRINQTLREAAGTVSASISPISERTIWRLISRYKKGDGRHAPGLASLQTTERRDKGAIHIHPVHAEYLTSLYLSGDADVKRVKLALERPRSANECLERIQLEISAGEMPGPAPSISLVRRWVREALPKIVCDYARQGETRALKSRGPYIVRGHEDIQVNQLRYWDFRRSNLRTWFQADGNLYRIFCCACLDLASRDVLFRFDLYPSAQLFKSTLRHAVLTWGISAQDWMDNGKEFTCESILGGAKQDKLTKFEVDVECRSVFERLGGEAHYCIPKNADGKACLERFFQTMDRFERGLPGWCGEMNDQLGRTKRSYGRPDRLKAEERAHAEFCAGNLPDTPLWRVDHLIDYLTARIHAEYRHRKHHGSGMWMRTPAQAQAAFDKSGLRKIPNAEQLDILLWHRKRFTARGDKVSIQYHHRALVFRAPELLALPGDCEVEVHVDPINVDRAVAITTAGSARAIVLEPCNPTGERSAQDLKFEIERQRSLTKAVKRAALLGSAMRPVRGVESHLELLKARAAEKEASLRSAASEAKREEFEMPEYQEAAMVIKDLLAPRPRTLTAEELAQEAMRLEDGR